MLYGTLLVDLQTPQSRGLVYWPVVKGFSGPVDDILVFAYSAKKEGERVILLLCSV